MAGRTGRRQGGREEPEGQRPSRRPRRGQGGPAGPGGRRQGRSQDEFGAPEGQYPPGRDQGAYGDPGGPYPSDVDQGGYDEPGGRYPGQGGYGEPEGQYPSDQGVYGEREGRYGPGVGGGSSGRRPSRRARRGRRGPAESDAQYPSDQRGYDEPGGRYPGDPGQGGYGEPEGQYPPEEDVGGESGGRRSSRRARRQGSVPPMVFFAAAGVIVVLAVVVAAAVLVFTRDGDGPAADAPEVKHVQAEGPGASAYSQAASTAAFAAIADRSKDAKPLTAAEVFATKKISDTDAKATLKLTASRLDGHCAVAIWGTRLAGLLQQGGCTQTARATYTDKHFGAIVTIFNMADAKAADRVVAGADPRSGNGFPLAPPRSPPFGQAFSTARGVAMGHYAVITWVQYADGSGDESDAALLSLLVTTGRPNAVLVRAAG